MDVVRQSKYQDRVKTRDGRKLHGRALEEGVSPKNWSTRIGQSSVKRKRVNKNRSTKREEEEEEASVSVRLMQRVSNQKELWRTDKRLVREHGRRGAVQPKKKSFGGRTKDRGAVQPKKKSFGGWTKDSCMSVGGGERSMSVGGGERSSQRKRLNKIQESKEKD